MKRFTLLTILTIFSFMAISSVHADEPEADKEKVTPWQPAANANHFPVRKLGRGTANFVFGTVEIPKNMQSTFESNCMEFCPASGTKWNSKRVTRCAVLSIPFLL